MVDGERVEGTWRWVFIHNGHYFLTPLEIYADGAIYCWEWVDLDGLAEKLRSGWVVTEAEPGGRGSAHGLASWTFDTVYSEVAAEELLGEVADLIDELNDRPDSSDRCAIAVDRFLASRSEPDFAALREAYDAVPEHLRMYVLGDQDAKDAPLHELCEKSYDEVMDPDDVTRANLAYFEEYGPFASGARPSHRPGPADDGAAPRGFLPLGNWNIRYAGEQSPHIGLRNDFPAPIAVGDETYPSVEHAYWAQSTSDPAERAAIRRAGSAWEIQQITAASAAPVPDFHRMRTAVMAWVLRLKFAQHPDLAELLLATGDAVIHYDDLHSDFWGRGPHAGGNWMGHLLELVRAELVAQRAGIPH
ncbi:NADAR family protein [Myceligenerans sp. TRM 65318]|uniref:NADAR family protein n=2 Tax=Myceligenerans pegani TaxID=2776917 RepID=A0ABR9MY18_9MICO|nr:NADAR family protein [Myceligenerans sp. TRM 65318]MBE3018542.1 NADAR family protein [Myceligenerans sp. TRM 65318]